MRDSIDVNSLPETMDKKYLRHLMRDRFKVKQFESAAANGRIMRSQCYLYINTQSDAAPDSTSS